MPSIFVPEGFSYVATALAAMPFILQSQAFVVGRYRRRANVAYPQMYAELSQVKESEAHFKFNCAQRAHQNTLEATPVVVISTVISSLAFPKIAAGACALWAVSRVLYTIGYLNSPSTRHTFGGRLGSLAFAVLFGTCYTTVYRLLQAGI